MAPRIPTITPKHTDGQLIRTRPIMLNASTVNQEALDHALVQCLRFFAQHGQKIRSQMSIPSDAAGNTTALCRVPESSTADQVARQKPHFGGGEG